MKLPQSFPSKFRQTRFTSKTEQGCMATDVYDDVFVCLKSLLQRLHRDLKSEMFEQPIVMTTELTREVTDIISMQEQVIEQGHIFVGLSKFKDFLKAARRITSTLDAVPDKQLETAFKRFLKKLEENYFKDNKDNKEMIKYFLDKENGLYDDIEVINACYLHCCHQGIC